MALNGYALIIAVGNYPELPKIKTQPDAEAIKEFLSNPARGYHAPNVTVLVDAEATKERIVQELAKLAAIPEDSNVFIYFSGHGARRPNSDGAEGSYLCAWQTVKTDVQGTGIASRAFAEAIGMIPARRKTVYIDACHAGGMEAESHSFEGGIGAGLDEAAYAEYAAQGQAVFASSQQNEKSYILGGDPNSLFTICLLEALGGKGLKNNEPYVLVSDLLGYVAATVEARSTKVNKDQHVYFRAEGNNFPVMINNADAAKDIDPDEAGSARYATISGEISSKGEVGEAGRIVQEFRNEAGRDVNQIVGDNNEMNVDNSTTNRTNSDDIRASGDVQTGGTQIRGSVTGNVNAGTMTNSGNGDQAGGNIDKSSTVNTGGGANISGGNFTSGGGQQVFGGTGIDQRDNRGNISTGSGSITDNRQTNDFGGVNTGGGAFTAGSGNTVNSNVGATQPSSTPPATTNSGTLRRLLLRQISSTDTLDDVIFSMRDYGTRVDRSKLTGGDITATVESLLDYCADNNCMTPLIGSLNDNGLLTSGSTEWQGWAQKQDAR